jgi:hypothetical protein
MAAGDRIFTPNIIPGHLILQPGAKFISTETGLDNGYVKWLTHPDTPESQWPQRGQKSPNYPRMFIVEVESEYDESGLITLEATYRGTKTIQGSVLKERIFPDCDIAMYSFTGLQITGVPPAGPDDPDERVRTQVNLVAPVPKPKVRREYLTTVKPSLDGVSQAATGDFFPELPTFSISYVPFPDAAQTINYNTGWRLDSRQWEDVADIGKIWRVVEQYSYYWNLAV